MPPEQSEQGKFLEDLQTPDTNQFEQPVVPPTSVTPTPPATDENEVARNRRERRLEAKLQAERESSIALAARLEALTEAQKANALNAPSEYLKQVERIYGTQSPEAQEATNLLATALQGVEERATERALAQMRAEQEKAQAEVRNAEKELEEFVTDIEDTYNVTLDKDSEKTFFQLLEKMSPKDRQGNIVAYADHHAVWEALQELKKPDTNTRAKDLASRSMVKTGANPATNIEADSQERWLRENGLI